MAGNALREVFARFGVDFDNGPLLRGSQGVNQLITDLGGLANVVGGGALVLGLRSFVGEMTRVGDSLNDTSTMLGVSTTELQEWQHVAEMNGSSADEFTMAMVRLQNRMAAGGQGAQVFAHLGVSIRGANGELRNASDVLTDLADPLSHVSSDAERTHILMDLLGRSGARLAPLFLQGSAGIRAARAELQELGGGATPQMIEQAAALDDANHRLDASWLSLRSRLAIFVLPAFEALTAMATRVNVALTYMADRGRLVEAVLVALGGVASVQAARTLAAWIPVAAPFVGAGLAIVGLILLLEDLGVALDGGHSVFQGFADTVDAAFARWASGDGPMAWLGSYFQWLQGVISATYDAAAELLNLAGADLPRIGDQVETLRGGTEEEALAYQIATQRRDAMHAAGGFASTFQDVYTPSGFERSQALEEAHRQLSTGAVPQGVARALQTTQRVQQITQTVSIAAIHADGVPAADVQRVVQRAVTDALTAQADDTLDVVAGG